MSIKVPRLYKNRHGVFYFRYLIPAHLAQETGQSEVRKSLKTKNPLIAKVIALRLNAQIERASKNNEGELGKINFLLPHLLTALKSTSEEDLSQKHQEFRPQSDSLVFRHIKNVSKSIPQSQLATFKSDYELWKKTQLLFDEESMDFKNKFGLNLNKFEVDISKGIFKSEGVEDHRRMLETLDRYAALMGEKPSNIAPTKSVDEVNQAIEQKRNPPQLFNKLTSLYLSNKARNKSNTERTIDEKIEVYKEFESQLGDIDISVVNKKMIVSFKDAQLNKGISPRQVKKKISYLSDFFQWAIDDDKKSEPNPCAGVKVISKREIAETEQHYAPFTSAEIEKIFNPLTYEKRMTNPYYYWIPLIGLYTGARIESIATIETETVKSEIYEGKEIHYLYLNDTKNRQSQRNVPIHSKLIELGFLDYVQEMKEKNSELLFAGYKVGKNGLSKNMVRRWAEYLGQLKIRTTSGKNLKVFHSFRATVITQLHTQHLQDDYIYQLTGHKTQSMNDTHHRAYVNPFQISKLQEVIETLQFPVKLKRKEAKEKKEV